MKHTPGPWYSVNHAGYRTIKTEDSYEAIDLLDEEDNPNAEADGLLCAAAPVMYDALLFYKEALEYIMPKLNLGYSDLDAKAVSYMNQMEIKGQAALDKATPTTSNLK